MKALFVCGSFRENSTAGGGHKRALKSLTLFFQICKMNVVGELAEVVGINDIDDMPELLQRAEAAGTKLGEALIGISHLPP